MQIMEKIPSFENFENKESEEQRLIRLLKEKGVEDPETRSFLNFWTIEQEKWAENSEDYKMAQIEVNLRRARLYFSAGYIDEAFENFEAARMQARNDNRGGLYQEIMAEMDKLESDSGQ